MKNITKPKVPFIVNHSGIKFLPIVLALFALSLLLDVSLSSLVFTLIWSVLVILAVYYDVINQMYLESISKKKKSQGVR